YDVIALGVPSAAVSPLPKGTVLFVYGYGDHRALLSFPTRRSSDLGGFMSTQTSFNTTTGFGIPNIGGAVAKVMKYTRSETPPDKYRQSKSLHSSNVANSDGVLGLKKNINTRLQYPDLTQGDQYSAV